MKAWTIEAPFGIDSLTLSEREDNMPDHGEALVRIRAVSLNYRDLMTIKNVNNRDLKPSLIPCSDGAGEVVAVGDGVTRVKVGDRVAGSFVQRWIAGVPSESPQLSSLGGAIDGVLAQQVLFDQEGLVHIPEHLSYEEASTLPCAGVTAWNALVSRGGLKAGDTILTEGTGGVSIFALQFGSIQGARVISTSSSDEKLDKTTVIGAAHTINYRSVPEWGNKAYELADWHGVDNVVEVAGGLPQAIEAARIGGTISVIGALGGSANNQITSTMAISKQLRIQGIYVGSREMFEDMNRAVSFHSLRPVIDRVFPFEEAKQALRHMESGAHFGKIVINC